MLIILLKNLGYIKQGQNVDEVALKRGFCLTANARGQLAYSMCVCVWGGEALLTVLLHSVA